MPHLNGKPFKIKRLPHTTGYFRCDISGAVSTSYDEHRSHRMKALEPIWVCSVTGRQGLTFEEAKQCEDDAMEQLAVFQPELGIPLLYLASRTQCSEFMDMVDQVSQYIRNRFFIGEIAFIFRDDDWTLGTVAEIHTSLDNEDEALERSGEDLPAEVFYYTIVLNMVDGKPKMLADGNNLRRKHYPEDIAEYLRLFFEKSESGIWEIRDHARLLYALEQFQFQNAFWGKPPKFPRHEEILEMSKKESPNREVTKKVLQVTLERYFAPHSSKRQTDAEPENLRPVKKLHAKTDGQKPTVKINTKHKVAGKDLPGQRKFGQTSKHKRSEMEEKRKKLEEKRRQRSAAATEDKRRMIEQKRLEKAKLKEEKQRLAQSALEERQCREDLECDDLKVLPTFSEVQCCIPNKNFADFMVLLEFLHSFKEALPAKTYFPHGVSFEVAERGFTVDESEGTFSDILMLLMSSLFTLQEVEDEKVGEPETWHIGQLEDFDDDVKRALELAAATRNYTHLCHGIPLRQFRLDAFSISEVVRLHLLTSGGYQEEKRAKFRCMRGGYSERDDPGLAFCIAEPELLNDMAYRSIHELALEDKLKIVLCLVHQLLTYPSIRDVIDKRAEKLRQMKVDLRQQLNEVKKKRDTLNLRLKEKKGAKPKGEEEMQSDAQTLVTDEDSQAEQIRIEKEILRKQQETTKKAKELTKIAMGFHALPLGTDRFFRRYWTFSSLPGLFVEHRGDGIEFLSSGETYKSSSAPVSDIGENPASSDKENDDSEDCKSRSSNSPLKKMLVENKSSPSLTSEKLGVVLQSSNKIERDPKGDQLHQDLVSITSHEFPVSSEPVWSFCCKEEDFHLLMERLNARGIREGPLRQVLKKEEEIILESVLSCPAYKLNPAYMDASNVPEVRKSSRNNPASSKDGRNFGHPPGTPLPQIWCELLRDEILDLDDRLYQGGLSVLNVPDRDAWRDDLLNKTFDMQCERLVWGCHAKSDEQDTSRHSITNAGNEDIDSLEQEIHRVIRSPFVFAHLSPSDPDIITAYACAILQVEQCIPRKNLKQTFVSGIPDEEISQLERWEMSLMNSTSYSQLYVHLLTLHNNVQWSKSVLKAYCRVCRRRNDPEKLLLCDECNRGYHIYCLKPKLNRVPHGDWFCCACKPKVAAPQDSSQYLSSSEESEANESPCESPADKCDICGLGDPSFSCGTCHKPFHLECCDPSTMKRTSRTWQCRMCSLREGKELEKAGSVFFMDKQTDEDSLSLSSNCGGGGVGGSGDGGGDNDNYVNTLSSQRRPSPRVHFVDDSDSEFSEDSSGSELPDCSYSDDFDLSLEVGLGSRCSSESNLSCFGDILDAPCCDDKPCGSRSVEKKESSESSKRRGSGSLKKKCLKRKKKKNSRYSKKMKSRSSSGPSIQSSLASRCRFQFNPKLLTALLKQMMSLKVAVPFVKLVSRTQAPDFYCVIKHPMDLTTVQARLEAHQYKTNEEFLRDVMLMLTNFEVYNAADDELYWMGRKLQSFFYSRCVKLNLLEYDS